MCFCLIQVSCFAQKNNCVQENSQYTRNHTTGHRYRPPDCRTDDQCESNSWKHANLGLFMETTDYWPNFAKTSLFENYSTFSKITFSISLESPRIFKCLISIPAGHWVRQIDSDLPRRFFLSALLSLVISKTWRSERSARALCDGADVVREAIGNEFCVRICYMFLLSKCRGDWDLVCAQLRDLRLENRCAVATSEKKRVSTQEKSDFAIAQTNAVWHVPFTCDNPQKYVIWLIGGVGKQTHDVAFMVQPIALECHLISISSFDLLDLFSTERGKKDLEN